MKSVFKIIVYIGVTLPIVAYAQAPGGVVTILKSGLGIVDLLVKVSFGLGLLFFFWGIAKFILAAGDESKHEEGKRLMIWGVVALFVMASIWGIVGFVQNAIFSRTSLYNGQPTSDAPTVTNTRTLKVDFNSN